MAKFTIVLLVAACLPWIACKAEDGSIQGDKKDLPSDAVSQPHAAAQRAVTRHRTPRVAQGRVHVRLWHFRPDWYYVRASASAWWPNAPGD